MRRLLLFVPALAVALLAMASFGTHTAVKAQDGNLTIRAGDGEQGYSVNQFLPREVTIAEGTTITWTFPWYEPHIVAFVDGVPPDEPVITQDAVWPNDQGYVFSGQIFGNPDNPPAFSVTFPEAGSYMYLCPIHPLMTATVNVVAAGGDTDTQAEVDARGEAEYQAGLAQIKAVAAVVAGQGGAITPRADGTKLLEVKVGALDVDGNDAMQFFPAAANINVGDTIVWTSDNATPHTVTFNMQEAPPFGDPFALLKTPEDTFGGQGFRNSGILWTVPEENSYTSYELTFTAAGSFNYICILHADQGMAGTVNVAAATTPTATVTTTATATATATKTATPAAPTAGTGSGGSASGAWLLIAGAAAAFMIGGGTLGAATLRRR